MSVSRKIVYIYFVHHITIHSKDIYRRNQKTNIDNYR